MTWQDKLEIREVFGRYALTVDARDASGWAALFTDDGIFEIEAGEGGPRFQFRGTDQLEAFVHAHGSMVPGTRHMMTGFVTTVDGDEATDHCTLVGHVNRPDKVYIFASGWYETTLRKVDGRWRIARRIAHCDNFEPGQFAQGELAALFGELNTWIGENGTKV